MSRVSCLPSVAFGWYYNLAQCQVVRSGIRAQSADNVAGNFECDWSRRLCNLERLFEPAGFFEIPICMAE